MVVVRVELHKPNGEIEELGRMFISNDNTGTSSVGNYNVRMMKKGERDYHGRILHYGEVLGYKRTQHPVWFLLSQAIKACYGSRLV